jgi:putative colanic acid biosynthesis UDP-glucose lipid carrier transferase
MDNFSVTNNLSASITDISSLEQNFSGLNLQEPTYADLAAYASVSESSVTSVTTPLEISYNFILKRTVDIIISIFLIIVLLSWLIPLLALFIKLDSRGPVFFMQKRKKNGGRSFTCIKFRSMIVNKEADILSAAENDKRITRVGKFIRHYHLDELPQLFNVLAGDMSLIGPRPHMVSENARYEKLVKEYDYRHTVKPGMTGLAQSLGNFGATSDLEKVEERVAFDLQYIRQWSVGMDIKIMYRTCKLMLRL